MSSPSSSETQTPYKSRLFNFFNRQYINIKEQVGKKARQLKLGLQWGIQILLYPFYLLVQTGRIATLKIKSTFQGNQLELNPLQNQEIPSFPPPDQPIKIVLKEISQENRFPSLTNINLQGFATKLDNNHLVLVNYNNKIIDILSVKQQKKLSLFMREIRGEYWEKKRIATMRRNKLNEVFPKIKPTRDGNILPLISFWQLMAWVQKSSIALSLNVFGESNYISSSPSKQIPSLPETETKENSSIAMPLGILSNIDQALAHWEKGKLFKFRAQNLAATNSTNSNNINIKQENNQFLEQNRKQNFSIQVLIQLAIDYFFGESRNQQKVTGDNGEALLPSEGLNNNQQLSQNHQKIISKKLDKIKPIAQRIKSNIEHIFPIILNIKHTFSVKIKEIYALNKLSQNNRKENLAVPDNLQQENDPFQIQALIWAAIDYFFNKKTTFLSSRSRLNIVEDKNKKTNSQKILSSREFVIEETWLSWDDLYGNNLDKNLSNFSIKGKKQEPKLTKSAQDLSNKDPEKNSQINYQYVPSSLAKNKHQSSFISNGNCSVNSPSNKPKKNDSSKSSSNGQLPTKKNKHKKPFVDSVDTNLKTKVNQSQLESQPDCLETKAVDLGHEKHFLQVILEWIDRIILWIEELFIKIFRKK